MTEPTDGVGAEEPPERIARRSVIVDAEPDEVFDLLADPAEHAGLDGSGTVRESVADAPDRLELGSRFGMKMKFFVPYRMTNEVVEFDEGRRIAWRHLGGHVWRYTLEPVADGRTKVTEEFDWRSSHAPWALQLVGYPNRNADSIEKTLGRLAERFQH